MHDGHKRMNNFMKFCKNKKIVLLYVVAIILLAISFFLGIMLGSTSISFSQILGAISNHNNGSIEASIFWYVRLPRICACIICGAALSVSGAVIQGVLANKLASPSILGVNSGAGLAVTLCASFGIYGGWQLSAFSFLGAFASVMLVSICSKKMGASRGTVILLGVALNSLLNAVSDTVITFNSEVGFMSNNFKIGEFTAVTYPKLLPASVVIIAAIVMLFTLTNELDIITLGDDNAKGLGMNTSFMRTLFLLLAALLAGCAVSLAGLLSFVGLIVPHTVRRISGNKSSHLLPLCAITGGAFLGICDTISRTLFSPYEIPVGIIMAFLGAPFFVFILIKGKGGHSRD